MSLWSSLLATYEHCSAAAGIAPTDSAGARNEKKAFLPLFHMTFKSRICVTLDGEGSLIKIEENPKDVTIIIPCTEESMSRVGNNAPHALCDQLEYVDSEMTPERYQAYMSQLGEWKGDNAKLNAVYTFLSKNSVAKALDRELNKEKDRKLGVRFSVQIPGDPVSNVWDDAEIRKLWIEFCLARGEKIGVDCFGEELKRVAKYHPKNIYSLNANAKLISCNDFSGFTFRGRFTKEQEALQIDAESTQKVHNTLKWLINNNGYGLDSQIVVIWAVDEDAAEEVVPFGNSFDIYGQLKKTQTDQVILSKAQEDADTNYAIRFRKLLQGYDTPDFMKQYHRRIVVAIFDAATTGRLGVTFYREFFENEYLENIAKWHEESAWHLTRFEKGDEQKAKAIHFDGCPSFDDIIECVYNPADKSSDSYKTLAKGVRKQLIECMFGNFSFPHSFVQMACNMVSKPQSYSDKQGKWLELKWRRNLEISCSLIRKYYIQKGEDIQMSLDSERTDRDYLYGRLLALADQLESYALYKQGIRGTRSTNAVKLWSSFVVKPHNTWGILWRQLLPYINQLNGAHWFQSKIDEVMALFKAGEFEDNAPLSPLYLLGYSLQRRELIQSNTELKNTEKSESIEEKGE